MVAQTSISSLDLVGYRADIDGLRAIAVVAVIINHFHRDLLPGGYLGVDIFLSFQALLLPHHLCDLQQKQQVHFLAVFMRVAFDGYCLH